MTNRLTIGVLCPVAGGFYFGGILNGVVGVVGRAGGRVISIQTLEPGLHEADLTAPDYGLPLAWSQLDGVVSISEAVEERYLFRLRDAGIPVVTISKETTTYDCPNVVPDNRGGIAAAVAHLVAHGHQRIAFVGNLVQQDIRERHAAYRSALIDHGIEPDPALLYLAEDNTTVGGSQAARDMLTAGLTSTATIVGTDRNAFGVMRVLIEAGLRLPEDQAIVGFDGVEEAAQIRPALTTVGVRYDRLGGVAAQLLLRMLGGERVMPGPHPAAASLIVRKSCGCGTAAAMVAPAAVVPAEAPEVSVAQDSAEPVAGPAASALDAPTGTDPIARLLVRLEAILMPEPELSGVAKARLETEASRIITLLTAVAEYGGVSDSALTDLADRLYGLGAAREALPGVVHALRDMVDDLVEDRLIDRDRRYLVEAALTDLALVLGQREGQDHTRFQVHLEHSMISQYDVGMALLRGDQDDPATLAWAEHANASCACLGLWTGGGQASSATSVRIAGVYDPGGRLDGLLGTELSVPEFPPQAVLDAVDASAGEVLFTVEVKTDDGSWGLLAAPGTINARSTRGRENLNHWAALLAVALKQKARRDALAAGYQREHELVNSLRISEERYAIAARAANDGLWDWNLIEDTIFYSARWSALLGYDEGVIGGDPAEWFSRVHPDDRFALETAIRECRQDILPVLEHEHRIKVSDGSYRWMLCRALAIRGSGATAVRMVGSLTDVDDRRRLEEQLRFGALYDPVTRLANRTLFLERLEWAINNMRRRPDVSFAVLFCDLDDFKVINDSLGHTMGDLLLTRVAGRLLEAIRNTDVAARLGGDEFAILLNDVDLNEVPELVRRVQAGIGDTPFDIDGHEVVVTASIGVAVSDAGYTNPVDVLRDADTAMYQAKMRERGTHQVFDITMHRRAMRRLSTEVELRGALDRGEFEMHYQPLVDLGTRRLHGFEALLRWSHPERGQVSPGEFLEVAEETGLILPLGRWVLDEVCRQIAQWQVPNTPNGPAVSVSVNVSNRQFWHGGLLEQTEQSLADYGLTPQHLRLEITEGVIMRSPEQAQRTMEELHRKGLLLHIDDFGTGYSSLESLHRFPIEVLKIDRSFVGSLGTGGVAQELITAIVAMARAIGVNVIAEGIETREQAELLQQLGCQSGQGYYFGRPQQGCQAASLIGRTLPVVTADLFG